MSLSAAVQASSPSESVVEKVAEREGVEPIEIDVPLFDVIDPDALDALVRNAEENGSRSPLQVAFTYYGYHVIVSSDGLVHVSRENTTS